MNVQQGGAEKKLAGYPPSRYLAQRMPKKSFLARRVPTKSLARLMRPTLLAETPTLSPLTRQQGGQPTHCDPSEPV